MNNVNITGRVAKDPETRGTVTTLIVATDRVKLRDGKTYVDDATGYTAKETEFHKVTCFNGLGKAGASRKKGDVVAITGRLHYSSWEDRDGVTRLRAGLGQCVKCRRRGTHHNRAVFP